MDNLWNTAITVYPKGEFDHIILVTGYACVLYIILHLLIHWLMTYWSTRYYKMTRAKQGEYRAYAISPFHSCTSCTFAVLAMFYVCPNGATVFNNEECIDTPRYIHIWGVVNSSAYFVVDLLNTVIIIREFSTYDIQMIVHHIISVVTFLGTLVFMNFTVVFGVMLLFVEVSTTYICIRWLLYTHRLHRTCCQTVNTILCFLTFLLGRLIYQVFILFAYGYPKLGAMFDDLNMPWYQVTLVVEMTLAITVSALMNTYWMFLIIH